MQHFSRTFLVLAGLLAPQSAVAGPLEMLIERAQVENPGIRAIEAQLVALEHRTTQAGAWKDPMLMIAYQNVPIDSFALGREAMSMVMFQVSQTVPFFGKTGAREGVVRMESEARRWELVERRNQLRAMIARSYYQLGLTRQLRKITEEHGALVEQLTDAVRIKYETGRAPQQNLLRLEVLRGRLRDDLADFDRMSRELTAMLNAAAHRNVDTPIETPAEFSLAAPTSSVAELMTIVTEERAALFQLDASAQMHRKAGALARAEAIPDPTFFVSYGLRKELPTGMGGTDMMTFGMSVPLPLFYGDRYGAKSDESNAQAQAIDAQRQALLDTIESGLAEALAGWERAAGKVRTYRNELIPQAHRALDSTFSSYQVDRADFLSLYEAELDLLNFEKTVHIATAEGLKARAQVELLIGKELP